MNPQFRRKPVLVFLLAASWMGVSCPPARAWDRAEQPAQVTGLRAWHQQGQTFLVWNEIDPPVTAGSISAKQLREIKTRLEKDGKVRYRIYRSKRPIERLDQLEPIAQVPPLTCWNADYWGIYPKEGQMAPRYVVEEGREPLPPGTGLYVCRTSEPGKFYYAVTVVVDGRESPLLTAGNCLERPLEESPGPAPPVLQRIEKPERFVYVDHPTLYYYVRWESPPTCSIAGKPFDYLVAVPPEPAKPAPVGLHLHCWGGSLNGGYGWWYNAEKGAMLLSTNQIPYDWWTGYHERLWTGKPLRSKEDWQSGVVHPYTQRRLFSFLDWVATRWDVDLSRTFVAGSSMGGSGSPMLAIRYPERVAWAVSWVGVHIPALSPRFRSSYARVWGKPEWNVPFEDGTPVWDYYNDAWFLRHYPNKEVGFLTFSNGKNDGGIGWQQAVDFYRALQETHRPHLFVWGQRGHGQRTIMPESLAERVLPIDIRVDATLPAFTRCSLDDDPGNGDPDHGDPTGAVNRYLTWQTDDAVDRPDRWELTVRLVPKSPAPWCTVDITPRRCQQFHVAPGETIHWSNRQVTDRQVVQQGQATADRWGLITLPQVRVSTGGNRILIERPSAVPQ